jgi:hypothetical protein
MSKQRIFIRKNQIYKRSLNHLFLFVTADEHRFTQTFCSADLDEQKDVFR